MDVPGAVVSTPVKRPPSSDDGARVCESPIAALATTTTIGGGGVVKGTPVKRGTVALARTIRAPQTRPRGERGGASGATAAPGGRLRGGIAREGGR